MVNIKRFQQTFNELNEFTDPGLGINRLAYTDTEYKAKFFLMEQFKKEGMTVNIDAIGNVIARREGTNPDLPVVAMGSHIDSVYEAGKFDGTVGVVAALEIIRSLNEQAILTEHPLEVISFACEESSRFGMATIGSKAMAGLLNVEDMMELKDKNHEFLKDALSKYALTIEEIDQARRHQNEFKSFFELHIEQGPVLEMEEKQIGIVTGIAGPTRYTIEINGKASHSGTTPMDYRQDAFLGAAEIALALENAAISEKPYGTVATIGVCEVKPGGMNIVPGQVEMTIDIRGISSSSKEKVINNLLNAIEKVEKERNLKISSEKMVDEFPIEMNKEIISDLREICESNNYSYKLMPSGAGHDTMNITHLCPTGLIFIPSKAGLSHNPKEYTSLEEIAVGIELLQEQILRSAKVIAE